MVLARFMKILSPNFVWRHKNKIINIHPSLLPSFPGPQAYRQAYEGGVKIAGVTAHFVSMRLDEGPIARARVVRHHARHGVEGKSSPPGRNRRPSSFPLKAVKLLPWENGWIIYWGVVREGVIYSYLSADDAD